MGDHKLSISLLDTKTGYTTPWHCSVALLATGQWISAPMGEFKKDDRLELVYEHGRPIYFREKAHFEDGSQISEANTTYLHTPKPFKGTQSGYSSPSMTSLASGISTPATSQGYSPPTTLSDAGIAIKSPQSSPTAIEGTPYGRRLIPQIMDELAVSHPNRVVFSLAQTTNGHLEFRDVSAQEFVDAVDKTAWWLLEQVGCASTVEPIGYIGPHDLRHVLITYACVKLGYAALYLSPKNSVEGGLSVLEATSCRIWAKASEVSMVPLVEEILQERPMKLLELPLLDDLLNARRIKPFPYTKTFDAAMSEPFCYLHTSGSTGVPKPIPWTHGLIGTMDAVRLLPPVDGLFPWTFDWKEGDSIYSSFPMCHGAGIIMDILMPALYDLKCVMGPPGVIPNISLIEQLVDSAKINIWSMVPSLVDELGETPDVLDKFRSPPSKFICASGGPVSVTSAGKVNEVVRVLNLTGTTEGLFIGNLLVEREDWSWFAFHPHSGFEFKEVEPGIYEHWVHRNEHASLFQGIFHTFPDKDSVNFKDLYRQHPEKPNLWAFNGRNDDLIVLSNGYKILPLEIEALIATHPDIGGCIMVGSNKIQAGLLIELKDPCIEKTDDMMESIWNKIELSLSSARNTVKVSRDYVIFSQSDKPFVRTDKGTIKRKATLALYEDYIDRFYTSRSNETTFTMDTSSKMAMQESIRKILSASLPVIQKASLDDDLFALGLDSLGVSAAVNAIRSATKSLAGLAPRHLYANPTLTKFTTALESMIFEAQGTKTSDKYAGNRQAKMQRMLVQRRAHQSFKLNPFDYVNPNHYMGLVFYLPLSTDATFEEAFTNLQAGLNRTLELIPALGGKMIKCSEHEIGYTDGDLCVAVPPFGSPARDRLTFKDLSSTLPSFETLRRGGFVPSAFKDEQVLRQDTFPDLPADILVAQANFVEGGCILAVDLNHCCLDGIGAIIAIKAWAENCRYLQGDSTASCEWYDDESFNHSLPEVLHELEGHSRPANEVGLDVWEFLPFIPPDRVLTKETSQSTNLPHQPRPYPLHSVWPLPAAKRRLDTTMFLIPPEKLELLKQDVIKGAEGKMMAPSISDIVQAFFWRSALRARHVVAKSKGREFRSDEYSVLELPTDGRPYFSSLLPSTYMGSLLTLNRTKMAVEELCSADTSILQISQVLRKSAMRMTPSLVHDAFTLLQSLPDHSRFSTANMGLDHMHAMISNMMLFQTKEINFGERYFGNGGSPETMRPQLERGNGRFRFLVVFPLKADGGVELVMGTFPEERDVLARDHEFTKYAELVDVASC